ncbi:MAG TPA: pitrilysin family protein [Bryobacteraceae bacterium]|nr:pitrilysin family protein [Bryobacteraceae bacterium]
MARRIAWLVCLAAIAFAANPTAGVFPFPYTQQDLPNGLRLVTIPTDYPNIVALYIVVQAGSRNEVEPGKTGFAHLFEHVMFKGTEKYPAARYQAVLNRAGAASNAYTTDDYTAYHTTFSKEDLETILAMEADRFRNLKYSAAEFKTETLAVLGEYNKNSADPLEKVFETLQETAFERHTYRHTTMGFLKDIQDMPNQYDYSLQFFDRYYRPEYTTLIVAGDVEPGAVRRLVDRHWGAWKRGSWKASIPVEPPQQGPRDRRLEWPAPTLPWLVIAYHGPAYSDTSKDMAALDALSYLSFSESSDLYQKLVIQEQKVDTLAAENGDHVDPNLFSILARIKKPGDLEYVRGQVLDTVRRYRDQAVPGERLEAVKKHLRYSFSLRLDNSETVASTAAHYVALRRTPDTIERLYAMYAQLTPQDIQRVARQYLTDNSRTTVSLTGPTAGGAK